MSEDLNMQMALRRASLFNIKVKNSGLKDPLGIDYNKQKELEIERGILLTVLSTKAGIKNPDDILLPIKKVKKNENNHNYQNRYK